MIAVENERPATEGIQRGRGGFWRNAMDVPYVSDPTGAVVKSGPRKGQVKRLAYGSPSNRGYMIENDAGLVKWKQRRALYGIGLTPELIEQCRHLATLEIDSSEYNSYADGIVVAANQAARTMLAADRGTHGHALAEDFDKGRDWSLRAEAGEVVGIDRATQARIVEAWREMLEVNGLKVLAIEAACVDDRWRLAGTLDRIVATTRPLRFAMATGEIVEVPAGIVMIVDIKFGKPRKTHPIQIASYAQSVPYDTEAEARGEWPFEIDQTHALIARGDIGDGVATLELVYVDLVAGREHGGQCVIDARAWAERNDVFSVAQLDTEIATGGTPAIPLDPPVAPDSPHAGQSPAVTAAAGGQPSVLAAATSPDNERLALVEARNTLATAPEQGADLSGADYAAGWDALQAHYAALDPAAKAWLAGLISEARRRAVSFHAREVRSLRTFELYRALISLAEAGGDQDELLRALLALVVGDVALHQGIHPGHITGSLGATEAARLAGLVDAFHADALVGAIGDDGVFVLREAAAA